MKKEKGRRKANEKRTINTNDKEERKEEMHEEEKEENEWRE